MNKDYSKLKEYMDQSKNTVVVTGAGISVSAGGVTYGQLMHNMRLGFGGFSSSDSTYESFLEKYRKTCFSMSRVLYTEYFGIWRKEGNKNGGRT